MHSTERTRKTNRATALPTFLWTIYGQYRSTAGVTTNHGLASSGFQYRRGQEMFPSPDPSRQAPGPTQPTLRCVPGLFPGCKAVGSLIIRPHVTSYGKLWDDLHLLKALSLMDSLYRNLTASTGLWFALIAIVLWFCHDEVEDVHTVHFPVVRPYSTKKMH